MTDCLWIAEWVSLNMGNFSFYRDWAFSDPRIIGFDPWPLAPGGPNTSSMALGLLGLPEVLAEYKALGQAILDPHRGPGAAPEAEI